MMIISSTDSYRGKVAELYAMLEKDGWSSLKLFEWRYRKIHLLNQKINCRSAELGKAEGVYSVY